MIAMAEANPKAGIIGCEAYITGVALVLSGVARAGVGAILAALDDLGRLPDWEDAVGIPAPGSYEASGVPQTALNDFLGGLAAEEAWRWDAARDAYQAAARARGFPEAEAALARTARLRLGGTLGES